MIIYFLLPLSITLALEVGIYMILKHKDLKLFIVVAAMNFILNPLMNLGLYFIYDKTLYWITLSICEVATVFIESLIVYLFMRIKYAKVLLFAFIANLTSFLVGLALNFLFETRIAAIVVCSLFFVVYLVTFGVVLSSFLTNRERNKDRHSDNTMEDDSAK